MLSNDDLLFDSARACRSRGQGQVRVLGAQTLDNRIVPSALRDDAGQLPLRVPLIGDRTVEARRGLGLLDMEALARERAGRRAGNGWKELAAKSARRLKIARALKQEAKIVDELGRDRRRRRIAGTITVRRGVGAAFWARKSA